MVSVAVVLYAHCLLHAARGATHCTSSTHSHPLAHPLARKQLRPPFHLARVVQRAREGAVEPVVDFSHDGRVVVGRRLHRRHVGERRLVGRAREHAPEVHKVVLAGGAADDERQRALGLCRCRRCLGPGFGGECAGLRRWAVRGAAVGRRGGTHRQDTTARRCCAQRCGGGKTACLYDPAALSNAAAALSPLTLFMSTSTWCTSQQ